MNCPSRSMRPCLFPIQPWGDAVPLDASNQHVRPVVTSSLVDCLIDPDPDIRRAAAQTIWATASHSAPSNDGMTFALCCLRNEIQESEMLPFMGVKPALQALALLRSIYPERREVFSRYLIFAWCFADEAWAAHGCRLLNIYGQNHSFLGSARESSRQVGMALDEFRHGARRIIHEAIALALGKLAARELEVAWYGLVDSSCVNLCKSPE